MKPLTSRNKSCTLQSKVQDKIIYRLIFTLAALAIIFAGAWLIGTREELFSGPGIEIDKPLLTSVRVKFNPLLFYPAVKESPAVALGEVSSGRALIVPHHDLASRLVAQAMARVSAKAIKTIYIIGPNHENKGQGQVITAPLVWQTDLGEVKAEPKLVSKLIQEGLAVSDAKRLSTEHAVNNLIPFVKFYFPKAKIIPIIINHETDKAITDRLADFITSNSDNQTLIIGSIDFSHYLPTQIANKNDEVTRQAILNLDYEKIFSFNDGFVDSPLTLATVMKAAGRANASKPEFIGHANLADIVNAENILSSTSYFTIFFK